MRVLIVEDEAKTAAYLAKGLREHGFVADVADDGRDGLQRAQTETYDIAILDVMLPGRDGWSVLQELRSSGNALPVLFLTARDSVSDRVRGLELGADDYLVKPFAFSELLARLEALLRRAGPGQENTTLRVGDLEMDLLTRKVTRQNKRVYLHPREFRLLEYLMRHAGQVVTRTMLLENVWEYHFDPQTNVIDVHISRLRQKIDKPYDTAILQTVRGAGYKLEPAG